MKTCLIPLLALLLSFELNAAIEANKVTVELSELSPESLPFSLTDSNTGQYSQAIRLGNEAFFNLEQLLQQLNIEYQRLSAPDSFVLSKDTLLLSKADTPTKQNINYSWFSFADAIFVNQASIEALLQSNFNHISSGKAGLEQELELVAEQGKRSISRVKAQQQTLNSTLATSPLVVLPNEYQLVNFPTGYYALGYSNSNTIDSEFVTLESSSDLFYHSAELALYSKNNKTNSRVKFSRTPALSDTKLWAGLDTYSFGDLIKSDHTSLDTATTERGVGLSASANLAKVQSQNMRTSFVMYARPGWQGELFHNGQYIASVVVPSDGAIEFNDMAVYFGDNVYTLQLYGPQGEHKTLTKKVNSADNLLQQGKLGYQFSLLEQQSSVFDLDSDSFDLDKASLGLRYGVNDSWTAGLSASFNRDDNAGGIVNSLMLNNAVSADSWLLENNLWFANDQVKQQTSVATSLTANDSLVLRYRSDIETENDTDKEHNFSASYNFTLAGLFQSLDYSYNKQGASQTDTFSHTLRTQYQGIYFNNYISYINRSLAPSGWDSRLSITTQPYRGFRVAAHIPYRLGGGQFIDESLIYLTADYTHFTGQAHVQKFGISHRDRAGQSVWQANYHYAYYWPLLRGVVSAKYDSEDNWQVSASINGYFGYDYAAQHFAFSANEQQNFAGIGVHTYLDRRINGVPDLLDLNLPLVNVVNGDNQVTLTNQQGRAYVAKQQGAYTDLTASWKVGSKTINNNYRVHSHPGASLSLNLPFYLTTELEFMVVTADEGDPQAVANVSFAVENTSTGEQHFALSDQDGYVNLSGLLPGRYRVSVANGAQLDSKLDFTTDTYLFDAPLRGGLVSLPDVLLNKLGTSAKAASTIMVHLTKDNYTPLLQGQDKRLIHLPPKGNFTVPYTDSTITTAEFELRQQSTEADQADTQAQLAKAQQVRAARALTAVSLSKGYNAEQATETGVFRLYVGEFSTLAQALRAKLGVATEMDVIRAINEQGKAIYRIFAGQYESMARAENIAQTEFSNYSYDIEKSLAEPSLTSGWVVQYRASSSLEDALSAANNRYRNIDALYVATKEVQGKLWYCLISREFLQQSEARAYTITADEDGFIVPSNRFIDIIWSK